MASLLQKPDEDSPDTLNTSTASGVGSGGATTSIGKPVNPASPGIANQQDTGRISALNQGVNFAPLLNGFRDQRNAALSGINSANTTFNSDLGQKKVFGDDQRNVLSSVLSGQSPLSDGQSLLNSTQTIQPIDRSKYDPLVSNYLNTSNQLQSDGGVNSLIGSQRPDLTPGERNFDSLVFQSNPKNQKDARAFADDAQNMAWLGNDTTTRAGNATTQRQNDINDFNNAGKSYVQSQADSVNANVNNMMNQTNQQNQQRQNDFTALTSGAVDYSQLSPDERSFQPMNYLPVQLTSQYGPNVFSGALDPRQYLTFTPGSGATRDNVATPQNATMYNNAESLLGLNDRLSPQTTARTPASIGINSNAYLSNLAKLQNQRAAADAAYLESIKPKSTVDPLANLVQSLGLNWLGQPPDVTGNQTGDMG